MGGGLLRKSGNDFTFVVPQKRREGRLNRGEGIALLLYEGYITVNPQTMKTLNTLRYGITRLAGEDAAG